MQKPLVFFGLSRHFLIKNKKNYSKVKKREFFQSSYDDDDNDNKDWTATEKYAVRNSQNFKEGA